MKTGTAIKLFQYWDRQRQGRPAPTREQIEPSDLREVLGDMVILESGAADHEFRFRLTGSRVSQAFGDHLRGCRLKTLFSERSHPLIGRLLFNCAEEYAVVLIGLRCSTPRGRVADYELPLYPLAPKGAERRILAALASEQALSWLGHEKIAEVEIRSIRVIDPEREPLYLANRPEIEIVPPIDGSPEASPWPTPGTGRHLVVIEGGLSAKD